MAEDRLSIDNATIFNNLTDRQIEFDAELAGDTYAFAVQYGVLEALGGEVLGRDDGDAIAIFRDHRDAIALAGTHAVGRGQVPARITIGENDLPS